MKATTARSTSGVAASAPAGYREHAGPISVRMGRYHLRHLTRLYRAFDGDILLAIVLGEVAHHNICRHFSSGMPLPAADGMNWESESAHDLLEPCTAFSLSAATGIPRETIRRKAATLIKRGWMRRHPGGGYVIRPAVAAHFREDFNVVSLVELLRAADDLRAILGGRRSEASRPEASAGTESRARRGSS